MRPSKPNNLRVLTLANSFPRISETFISFPFQYLLDKGFDIEILAAQRPPRTEANQEILNDDTLKNRIHFLGCQAPTGRIKHIQTFLGILCNAGLRSPATFTRAIWHIATRSRSFSPTSTMQALAASELPDFDVVHAHFLDNGFAGLALAKLKNQRLPLVVTVHGVDVNQHSSRRRAIRLKELFASHAIFTANTAFTAQTLVKLGASPHRVHVIPAPVNFADIEFRRRNRPSFQAMRVLTIGRLVEKKGMAFLLRAVAQSKTDLPIELDVVGGGVLDLELRSLTENLGLSARVRFHGWCSRARTLEILGGADVFVLASVTAANGDREGQGVVLQEAQAAGLPVISTLHNGIPDGVLDGISGFLVPEGDSAAIARKLELLDRSRSGWAEMGSKGSAFVRKSYSLDKIVCEHLKIYDMAFDEIQDACTGVQSTKSA